MIPAGFEPATVRLEGECSIQLSYGGIKYSPYGIRTRVTAVKRRCLNPLTNGPSCKTVISII